MVRALGAWSIMTVPMCVALLVPSVTFHPPRTTLRRVSARHPGAALPLVACRKKATKTVEEDGVPRYLQEVQEEVEKTRRDLEACEEEISAVKEAIVSVETQLASASADDVAYLRREKQLLLETSTTIRRVKEVLNGRLKDDNGELRRRKREGDPERKRSERERAATKKKTFFCVYQRPDGKFAARPQTLTRDGWEKLRSGLSPIGFEEIPSDLVGAFLDGKDPRTRIVPLVFEFADVVEGSYYAAPEQVITERISTLDRSVSELIAHMNNNGQADEDAFGRFLEGCLPRCFGGLVKVDIARQLYDWNGDSTLAARFVDLVERIRAGENETTLVRELADLTAGKTALAEFDSVLIGDDVVVVAEVKSSLREDALTDFSAKIALIRIQASQGDANYAIFRGKKILPVVYGGFLGGPETQSRVREKADRQGLLLYARNGHEMAQLLTMQQGRHLAPRDEPALVVECEVLQRFLREPLAPLVLATG